LKVRAKNALENYANKIMDTMLWRGGSEITNKKIMEDAIGRHFVGWIGISSLLRISSSMKRWKSLQAFVNHLSLNVIIDFALK